MSPKIYYDDIDKKLKQDFAGSINLSLHKLLKNHSLTT